MTRLKELRPATTILSPWVEWLDLPAAETDYCLHIAHGNPAGNICVCRKQPVFVETGLYFAINKE
jgi:hypothetical protein